MSLDAAAIHARLRERFGETIGDLNGTDRDAWALVPPAEVAAVARFAHDDGELGFDCLSNLSGVDYPKDEAIQVIYHLFSYRDRHWFVLKVNANRDDPVVASVTTVWPHADWQEREVFDLLGVRFDGHPDLRRILMPEDWPGHPLRKDFVEPEEFHGISTSRESLLRA
jgi:NADH-quinone oxidoreductase subunit C